MQFVEFFLGVEQAVERPEQCYGNGRRKGTRFFRGGKRLQPSHDEQQHRLEKRKLRKVKEMNGSGGRKEMKAMKEAKEGRG